MASVVGPPDISTCNRSVRTSDGSLAKSAPSLAYFGGEKNSTPVHVETEWAASRKFRAREP
jgi:hypothetical protein